MSAVARIAAFVLACPGLPLAAADADPREALAEKIVASAGLDRLILANARARALADPRLEKQLDDILLRLRPPAVWNAQHPAWGPVKAALREMVVRDSNAWIAQYSDTRVRKGNVRELAASYRRDYLAALAEFAESPGGQAYFGRRVAEARLQAGEAMFSLEPASPAALEKLAADARRRFESLPAAERQRVKAFAEDAACTDCGNRSNAQFLDITLNARSKWLGDMMVLHLSSPDDYPKRDRWRAELGTRFAAQLPVESKKQLLGILEMAPDATLVFRFTFYANNAMDGGKLALQIPRSHPHYAETLALAPGLAAGQSRTLYRDRDGVIGDQP